MDLGNIYSKSFRRLNFFFYVVIVLLIAGQLFWLNKIYNYQQKEFNTSVVKSIKGMYEDLELMDSSGQHLRNLIEQPDEKSFLFKTDSIPFSDDLVKDAAHNLEDFGVFTLCNIGVYNSDKNEYVQIHTLPSAANEPKIDRVELPVFHKNYNYILLSFPHRDKYIFYRNALVDLQQLFAHTGFSVIGYKQLQTQPAKIFK